MTVARGSTTGHSAGHSWHSHFLYLLTDAGGAANGKLVRTAVADARAGRGRAAWADVFPYDAAKYLTGLTCFEGALVVEGRQGGLSQIWVAPMPPLPPLPQMAGPTPATATVQDTEDA